MLPQAKAFRFSANYRKLSVALVAIGMTLGFYWSEPDYKLLLRKAAFGMPGCPTIADRCRRICV